MDTFSRDDRKGFTRRLDMGRAGSKGKWLEKETTVLVRTVLYTGALQEEPSK